MADCRREAKELVCLVQSKARQRAAVAASRLGRRPPSPRAVRVRKNTATARKSCTRHRIPTRRSPCMGKPGRTVGAVLSDQPELDQVFFRALPSPPREHVFAIYGPIMDRPRRPTASSERQNTAIARDGRLDAHLPSSALAQLDNWPCQAPWHR
eukprot:scaffold18040_cov107-Isochrysis_galbana.AAC.4